MRRLLATLTAAALTLSLLGVATAKAPIPPRPDAERSRVEPRPERGDVPIAPAPPTRPWTKQDAALAAELFDHLAAIVETVAPHGDDAQAAEAALNRYFAVAKTSAAELRRKGEALNEAMQGDPTGFSEWMQSRLERLQRLGEEMSKVSPAVQQMLTRVFATQE